jgi:hypothetical protein
LKPRAPLRGAKEKPKAHQTLNRQRQRHRQRRKRYTTPTNTTTTQASQHGHLPLQRESGRERVKRAGTPPTSPAKGSYAERAGYEDLEATGYGNLPSWAEHEPAAFWSAADRHERANGATYREIEIALPRELNPAQRQELVLDFIRHEIGERHAHQWAIHNPGAALAGGEQPHAHLMYSERTVDGIDRDPEQYFKRYNGKHPELGGCRKDSAGTEERLLETRQRWAEVQNAHLQQHGHAARVDHRSLADQGIDRAPEQHLGGRRVRQLAPEQREALLERREAEDELLAKPAGTGAVRPLAAPPRTDRRRPQREQKEQAARMAEARAYCQHALNAFRAELAQKAEQERALEAERAHPATAGALAERNRHRSWSHSPPSGSVPSVRGTLASRPRKDDGAAPSATRAVPGPGTPTATVAGVRYGALAADSRRPLVPVRRPPIRQKETDMDPQQLLATLIQLSDEQQHRIAELLNRLEQQTRTLTTASQRAAQAANALDHNGQKTALHLQAAVQESVETTLHDTSPPCPNARKERSRMPDGPCFTPWPGSRRPPRKPKSACNAP